MPSQFKLAQLADRVDTQYRPEGRVREHEVEGLPLDIMIIRERQECVGAADVGVSVAVQSHIGHRYSDHALTLLNAMKLVVCEILGCLSPMVKANVVQRLGQEVTRSTKGIQDQLVRAGSDSLNDESNDVVRGEVLAHACP